MTQTFLSKVVALTPFEYEFLTDTWVGVRGAAYNQCYEFCKDFGWCDQNGKPTSAGYAAIQAYEMEQWNI